MCVRAPPRLVLLHTNTIHSSVYNGCTLLIPLSLPLVNDNISMPERVEAQLSVAIACSTRASRLLLKPPKKT